MLKLFRKKVKQEYVIEGLVTLHQAMEGILIFGATGSGKTSGPGKEIALSLLRNKQMGGLVLCAKSDEFGRWRDMGERFDRDVIRWGPGCGLFFPFLEYELTRPGGGIMSAEAVMSDIVDATAQVTSRGSSEPFWPIQAKRQLRNAIAGVWLGTGKCDPMDLFRFVTSMPMTAEEIDSPKWKGSSFCNQCLNAALNKGHGENPDFKMACEFVREWGKLADRTSSGILAHTMVSLDPFMTADVSPLVNSGGKRIAIPELVLAGKIVVVDTPVLAMREPGRLCNIAAKVAVQRGVLARQITPDMRPVFLFADEQNWFAIAGIDALVQSVARQSRFINVAMGQNVPLLQRALGGDSATTDLGGYTANFQTKIFCQNSCPVTNQSASQLIGQTMQITLSGGGGGEYDPVADMMGRPQKGNNASWSEQMMPTVRPEEFSRLRKGGIDNNLEVDAILFQSGRRFSNGRTWTRATFNQRI